MAEKETESDRLRVEMDLEDFQRVAADRTTYRAALERITEAYDDPKKMVDIAWEALDG